MPWKDGYTISDEVGITDTDIRWPGGRRLGVHIVVNLNIANGPSGITRADIQSAPSVFAIHEGLGLVIGALARHNLKATVAVPAVLAKAFPDRIRALADAGHEIAALGAKGEDISKLVRGEEQARIKLATEILAEVAGARPTGWFTLPRQQDPYGVGTVSPATIDLLVDEGYAYFGNGLADDAPHYWVFDFARRRALLALPYYYHFDDQYFAMFPAKGTGLENSDMLVRNWRAEFDAQYRRGRFFTMVLHPQHAGWCNRLELLEGFLAETVCRPGLWVATGAEIARHWRTNYPPETHLNLEPPIWKDYPGSLS
jgi:peptidoglycan-N-acetylglucosamine deacetylase